MPALAWVLGMWRTTSLPGSLLSWILHPTLGVFSVLLCVSARPPLVEERCSRPLQEPLEEQLWAHPPWRTVVAIERPALPAWVEMATAGTRMWSHPCSSQWEGGGHSSKKMGRIHHSHTILLYG